MRSEKSDRLGKFWEKRFSSSKSIQVKINELYDRTIDSKMRVFFKTEHNVL